MLFGLRPFPLCLLVQQDKASLQTGAEKENTGFPQHVCSHSRPILLEGKAFRVSHPTLQLFVAKTEFGESLPKRWGFLICQSAQVRGRLQALPGHSTPENAGVPCLGLQGQGSMPGDSGWGGLRQPETEASSFFLGSVPKAEASLFLPPSSRVRDVAWE